MLTETKEIEMQIEEYADKLRSEFANRHAVAFGLMEQVLDREWFADAEVRAELGRIRQAMNLVEAEQD